MGEPAAKKGDHITATDTHIVLLPGPTPTPRPHSFNGTIDDKLSGDVNIMGMPAATVGSIADNIPPHVPNGGPFQKPPSNRGEITTGSTTVNINNKPAARNTDKAKTCNDPIDMEVGTVVAEGTVNIG